MYIDWLTLAAAFGSESRLTEPKLGGFCRAVLA